MWSRSKALALEPASGCTNRERLALERFLAIPNNSSLREILEFYNKALSHRHDSHNRQSEDDGF